VIKRKLQGKVAVRLLAICLFGCLTGFLFFDSPYWMAGIWTALITIGLFYETVRFVGQSEQKLTSFLQALHQSDFSITFSENIKSNDYDLHKAFNQLNEIFKKLRSDRESQHQLLQIIVEYAGAPMVCFEETNDEVYMINNAAKNLFQIPFLQKISSLARVDQELVDFVRGIRDGEKATFKLVLSGKSIFLSALACHVKFDGKELKLVALHDVSSELAAKEAETWQKLLRVLTHEISNSAIPLSTLSSFTHDLLVEADASDRRLTPDERQDVLVSLRTIDARSKSLKEFVQNFRSVNQIPEPVLQKINAYELVHQVGLLFAKDLEKENIELNISQQAELPEIFADKNLTFQVLINLVKNAIEAMSNFKENKKIEVAIQKEGSRFVQILVRDRGMGIDPSEMDQIFIPFYSTKKGGSGIGLSISQQIMQKQRGDISVQSEAGKGSTFTLSFSC
jgi:two-component system, NtrC family, nitrogen regulation sensor histidine kinase NtrY